MNTVAAILFWLSAGALVYTHLGYPLVLWTLTRLRRFHNRSPHRGQKCGNDLAGGWPAVSLIVPAYDEEGVIGAKVANALALDYPRERLQIVVASDGSSDATAERAGDAGADLVLELPAGGKVAALNAGAAQAGGEILAFSDANSTWAPDALRQLVASFADPTVGYVCGQVRFLDPDGNNVEGAYWRYEMAVREMESALAGVTAGNGAIYAVRRDAYLPLAPSGSHDLSFPFAFAKRGLRSLYAPAARAEEKMVPTIEGEFDRKRRMMVGLWDIVVGEGMLSPRGYPGLFAFEIASHRLLRYLSPLLHVDRPARQPLPPRRRLGLRPRLRPAAGAARRGVPRSLLPDRAVSRRPSLRPHHRLDRRRPLGPLPPRGRGPLGEGGGDPLMPRAFDILIAALALAILSPLLLVAAIAIKLSSRGPAFYRQRRVGLDGARVRDVEAADDGRRLRPGRRSAKSSTATTPASPLPGACCVAPRSTRSPTSSTSSAARWRSSARARRSRPRSTTTRPHQKRRHEVLPGITGWAQVQGRAGIPWEERIELDVWYVEHRSAALDTRILAKTLWLVLTGQGLAPD